ncbi:MAG: hypothetical protein OEW37_03930 [Rhodospirillaceae bacterium]|nr:hypothetical protein [Rhodospirillaceae bacterium]
MTIISKKCFSRNLLVVGILSAGLILGGCASTPPASTLPEIGFSHLEKINIQAGSVEIVSEYKSSLNAPFVEHRFPTSPEKAAIKWAKSRLVAVGASPAKVRFIIIDASVREEPVEKQKTGIVGIFTTEPTADYFAKLEAKLVIEQAPGQTVGEIRVIAERNILIHEDVSLAGRERIWLELVETLVADFNNEMESQIRANLSQFIR